MRDATAYGPTVPKGEYSAPVRPLLPEITIAGEDCLNLNVWTPACRWTSSWPPSRRWERR